MLTREKRRATELRGRDRLTTAAPRAKLLLEQVALRGGHLGGTTARLLRLLDREGPRELDVAIGVALARGAASAEAVGAVLDQRRRARKAPPAIDVLLSEDARRRDVDVTPHSLDSYDDALDIAAKKESSDDGA